MSTPRKDKTVLRTIRINQQLDSLLQKDAKSKSLSLNALITSVLNKYADWDRYTEKFGFISLTRDSFKSILETVDEERLTRAAREAGGRVPREFMLFWFKRISVETFLRYISLFCRYGQVAEYEVETDGKNYTITAHHSLGENWSIFLRHMVEQGMKTTLGITPEFETSRNSVVGRFTVNQARPRE